MAPTWSQLADSYKSNKEVVIAQVDCTTAKDVCEKAEVTGYPSLKSYYNGESHATFRGNWPATLAHKTLQEINKCVSS
jgi:hypothetical protein